MNFDSVSHMSGADNVTHQGSSAEFIAVHASDSPTTSINAMGSRGAPADTWSYRHSARVLPAPNSETSHPVFAAASETEETEGDHAAALLESTVRFLPHFRRVAARLSASMVGVSALIHIFALSVPYLGAEFTTPARVVLFSGISQLILALVLGVLLQFRGSARRHGATLLQRSTTVDPTSPTAFAAANVSASSVHGGCAQRRQKQHHPSTVGLVMVCVSAPLAITASALLCTLFQAAPSISLASVCTLCGIDVALAFVLHMHLSTYFYIPPAGADAALMMAARRVLADQRRRIQFVIDVRGAVALLLKVGACTTWVVLNSLNKFLTFSADEAINSDGKDFIGHAERPSYSLFAVIASCCVVIDCTIIIASRSFAHIDLCDEDEKAVRLQDFPEAAVVMLNDALGPASMASASPVRVPSHLDSRAAASGGGFDALNSGSSPSNTFGQRLRRASDGASSTRLLSRDASLHVPATAGRHVNQAQFIPSAILLQQHQQQQMQVSRNSASRIVGPDGFSQLRSDERIRLVLNSANHSIDADGLTRHSQRLHISPPTLGDDAPACDEIDPHVPDVPVVIVPDTAPESHAPPRHVRSLTLASDTADNHATSVPQMRRASEPESAPPSTVAARPVTLPSSQGAGMIQTRNPLAAPHSASLHQPGDRREGESPLIPRGPSVGVHANTLALPTFSSTSDSDVPEKRNRAENAMVHSFVADQQQRLAEEGAPLPPVEMSSVAGDSSFESDPFRASMTSAGNSGGLQTSSPRNTRKSSARRTPNVFGIIATTGQRSASELQVFSAESTPTNAQRLEAGSRLTVPTTPDAPTMLPPAPPLPPPPPPPHHNLALQHRPSTVHTHLSLGVPLVGSHDASSSAGSRAVSPVDSISSQQSTNSFHARSLTMMTKQQRRTRVEGSHKESAEFEYRLGSLIGSGATSQVYKAFMMETGETVAVKVIKLDPTMRGLDMKLAAIKREIEILKKLEHEHVVQYLFSTVKKPSAGGSVFAESNELALHIVMEYVGGGTISDIVREQGRLEERTAAVYAAQVALGLEYLHGQDIVLADLKPLNCLVTHSGLVKLTDFGCSVVVSEVAAPSSTPQSTSMATGAGASGAEDGAGSTEDGASRRASQHLHDKFGTPEYMAPECIRGEVTLSSDRRLLFAGDVWAFGAQLMFMLTGQPPFSHISDQRFRVLSYLANDKEPITLPPVITDNVVDVSPGAFGPAGSGTMSMSHSQIPTGAYSRELVDLLSQCLRRDPYSRPTASEICAHPWFAQRGGLIRAGSSVQFANSTPKSARFGAIGMGFSSNPNSSGHGGSLGQNSAIYTTGLLSVSANSPPGLGRRVSASRIPQVTSQTSTLATASSASITTTSPPATNGGGGGA